MTSRIIKQAFFLILFGFMLNIFAQDNKTDIAAKATDKLQQKLLLSNDQAAKIKNLVLEHFDQLKRNEFGDLQTKIEALLNEKQKEKFNIIKKDWLNSFQKK